MHTFHLIRYFYRNYFLRNSKAYTADKIFTGEAWMSGMAILAEDGVISDVVPIEKVPAGTENVSFPKLLLAPAFIDLQIYGAYGKLLAAFPEADSLKKLVDYCAIGGATLCLPTVATNTYAVFHDCIDAVRSYSREGGQGVLGLHIEGPWINPAKRGAHIEKLIHSPSTNQVRDLLDYGKDVIKMITLAPEVCSREVIDLIRSRGIVLSAGHSNATYQQAMEGFDAGIPTVTHLYNAMSPFQHRQAGLVGATFDHPSVMASIIPDGYHADFSSVRIAKKIMRERLFVITDAVTETDNGYYPHQRAGDKYESSGILSGSALNMGLAVKNLVTKCGIELGEAIRMCSLYPAKLIGIGKTHGMIAKGYSARMVIMNDDSDISGLTQ
ncbi:MAG: N-acetylglucosamine-6-phosphate deacetylase [Chitinophagaceae bacterium]|nr:N-acetylglucosamine-6-phosphate deacetylase [Chitinophagaceae bacterium]